MRKEREILGGPIYRIRLNGGVPLDYSGMMEHLNVLVERYPFLSFSYLGETILGRGIPMLSIGTGDRALLFVGAQLAGDWMTSMCLLRWLDELCDLYASNGKIFRYSIGYLLSTRRIVLLPMLNPDGVEYALHGVGKENILYDRLRSMNGGRDDYSLWQANARGVDLSHNYPVGFFEQKERERLDGILSGAPLGFAGESSESEPEVGALCNYLRYHRDIRAVLDLQMRGETISYDSQGRTAPRSQSIAESLSALSGYRLEEENRQRLGSLSDFCIVERNLPAFTIRCGAERAPLLLGDIFYLYDMIVYKQRMSGLDMVVKSVAN